LTFWLYSFPASQRPDYELPPRAPCPDNPLLKLTVQMPDISIGSGLFGFELAILDLMRNVKLKQKDHRD
jgi:hypothetical protein